MFMDYSWRSSRVQIQCQISNLKADVRTVKFPICCTIALAFPIPFQQSMQFVGEKDLFSVLCWEIPIWPWKFVVIVEMRGVHALCITWPGVNHTAVIFPLHFSTSQRAALQIALFSVTPVVHSSQAHPSGLPNKTAYVRASPQKLLWRKLSTQHRG